MTTSRRLLCALVPLFLPSFASASGGFASVRVECSITAALLRAHFDAVECQELERDAARSLAAALQRAYPHFSFAAGGAGPPGDIALSAELAALGDGPARLSPLQLRFRMTGALVAGAPAESAWIFWQTSRYADPIGEPDDFKAELAAFLAAPAGRAFDDAQVGRFQVLFEDVVSRVRLAPDGQHVQGTRYLVIPRLRADVDVLPGAEFSFTFDLDEPGIGRQRRRCTGRLLEVARVGGPPPVPELFQRNLVTEALLPDEQPQRTYVERIASEPVAPRDVFMVRLGEAAAGDLEVAPSEFEPGARR